MLRGDTLPAAEPASTTPAVAFVGVKKSFGDVHAVDGVDLTIADGEFFSLLGPSGSGKTTCLRMLGGFEPLTAGRILLHGTDVSRLPPYLRDVNTVFQDYALFPHMTVAQNVGYGLMVAGVDKKTRKRRVAESLELVALDSHGNRKPSQLSGGQRQRVALARALINQPSVLLLDEPLGALDLQLRRQMQVELKALQRDVGISFVFVTHDQEEALTMSDRVAVMNEGRVAQAGSPTDLYENPASLFVATFVGHSNIITDPVATDLTGQSGSFVVRPERVELSSDAKVPDPHIRVLGEIVESVFLGMYFQVRIRARNGIELIAAVPNTDADDDSLRSPGRVVTASWHPSACRRLEQGRRNGTADAQLRRQADSCLSKTTDSRPSQPQGDHQ